LTALTERVAEGDFPATKLNQTWSIFLLCLFSYTPLAGKTKSGYGNAGSGVLPPDGPYPQQVPDGSRQVLDRSPVGRPTILSGIGAKQHK